MPFTIGDIHSIASDRELTSLQMKAAVGPHPWKVTGFPTILKCPHNLKAVGLLGMASLEKQNNALRNNILKLATSCRPEQAASPGGCMCSHSASTCAFSPIARMYRSRNQGVEMGSSSLITLSDPLTKVLFPVLTLCSAHLEVLAPPGDTMIPLN